MNQETIPIQPRTNRRFNLVLPTLGGIQLWTDQFVYEEYRIQRNYFTGHCRLLSPANLRLGWGSFEACRVCFEEIREQKSLPPLQRKAVVLMHGLGRTRGSMTKLARHFRSKGYSAINIEYSSTRGSFDDHAHALDRVIRELSGVEEIYFVAHSMGNIVFRRYLYLFPNQGIEQQGDERIKSAVMIGPPNQGSYLAGLMLWTGVFNVVAGKCGRELGGKWEPVKEYLATPKIPFAIVAGKYKLNPLFTVDNDTTVSVDETRLSGATDFQTFPTIHPTMMRNKNVIEAVDRFFHMGHLISKSKQMRLKSLDKLAG